MAWTTPMTAVADSIFTASQFNRYVRDNLVETAPAKVTAAGQILATQDVNRITNRTPRHDRVDEGDTTDSDTYTDLSTPGPTVSVETGPWALVCFTTSCINHTTGRYAAVGYEISGATSRSAGASIDRYATDGMNDTGNPRFGSFWMETSLNPGTNVFQLKYRRGGGTSAPAFFRYRYLLVIPF